MSRQRRNTIVALTVVLAAAIVLFDLLSHREKAGFITRAADANTADFAKYHGRVFTVVNVVDGDTLDINIPDGQYDTTRIRLWGVDTPETKRSPGGEMYFGPEASAFATELALGKNVTVWLDKGNSNTRGKYGRLLAYVQLPDSNYLNELLLIEGYAYADWRFKHSFYYKYKRLESAARSLKKGLWLNVTEDQMPGWRRQRQ